MKNELAYSELTDKVYFINGSGKKVEISERNFVQMVLLWINQGLPTEAGSGNERILSIKSTKEPIFKISCKRLK